MLEFDRSKECDELVERIWELEAMLWEIEWACPNCDLLEAGTQSNSWTFGPQCQECDGEFTWAEVLLATDLQIYTEIEAGIRELNNKLAEQPCPICGTFLAAGTDWVLRDDRHRRHQIATIGTSWNAPEGLEQVVRLQIASNLAAYDMHADAWVDLGLYGEMWVQCPTVREQVESICWGR